MRICFLGDSFVNGTGDPDCFGWAGRLCAAARGAGLDVTYYNLGIRRDTSGDILRRWREEALLRLPSDIEGRLVFSFGANDCVNEFGRRRVSAQITMANTRQILARAVKWKPTLFIGPPPIGDVSTNQRIEELSAAFKGVAEEVGVPYLDVFSTLANSEAWMDELRAGDGAHPASNGYGLLAGLVHDWEAWQSWLPKPVGGLT